MQVTFSGRTYGRGGVWSVDRVEYSGTQLTQSPINRPQKTDQGGSSNKKMTN